MNAGTVDAARLFADAQNAFASGDGAAAVDLLDRLPVTVMMDNQVLHFRALALRKAGRLDEAQTAFERARQSAPNDPELANNHANLLMQLGKPDQALALYERALAIRPDYRDACFNRALALQALGRFDEALAVLDAIVASAPAEARAHSARGAILLTLDRYDDAADAFDRSLASGQQLTKAQHGRARISLQRGEVDASRRYQQLHTRLPDDVDILLGLAEALEAEGDPAGIAMLTQAVVTRPDWIAGQERLAQMRAETGEANFADHYQSALDQAGDQRPLRLSLAKMLAGADRYSDAFDTLAPLSDDLQVTILRAYYLGEAGDPKAGLDLLDKRSDGEALMIAGRLALASGDLDRALGLLEQSIAAMPDSIAVWAHCELAWRLTGDPRADWLSGQEGLVAFGQLGLGQTEIAAVVDCLRQTHRTRSHPIGQSLRGGTQTRGRLFCRLEPEIRLLHDAVQAAVADHVAALPAADARHPLLKYRDRKFTLAGSWSVRLTASGFHVQHIHPEGLLSSACYLVLPPAVADSEARAGWLELGRPPAALNLDLEPITTIQPEIGGLALFPSYLFHGTRPFSDGERMTVAFDVVAG